MNLNTILAVAALVILVALVFGMGYLQRKRPRTLNVEYFQTRWKEIQNLCGDKTTWPLAIIDADKLLDEALKQNKIKGKTMGERLVAVQRSLTDNDGVWYAHKLRNRLVHEQDIRLKEKDVKQALIGFRQALKDLGALK
ncbi:MAG TPA: hypothetical protein VK983_00805 [Candidatus Limnocylindrales bacterium]|nr:hypothetical protein [Candidatus Limnocylindrales bacterium]